MSTFNTFGLLFLVLLGHHQVTSGCSNDLTKTTCLLEVNATILRCVGGLQRPALSQHLLQQEHQKNLSSVKSVYLTNFWNFTLDLHAVLEYAPNAENVVVSCSNVTHLKGPTRKNIIKTITINNSTLVKIFKSFSKYMGNLEMLDLRHNWLQTINLTSNTYANLTQVYLKNNRWNCSMGLDWFRSLKRNRVKDFADLKCFGGKYNEVPVEKLAVFFDNSQKNCPKTCDCHVYSAFRNLAANYTYTVEVNCQGRGLEDMPDRLPVNTERVLLQNNDIHNLRPLIANSAYKSVLDLYLDHNSVEDIDELEGKQWLINFRVLSLHGNQLSQLPTYALDYALQENKNPYAIQLRLGDNPWSCDCAFVPGFQELLMKFQTVITDTADVRCAYLQGDDNSMAPVLGLSRASVCQLPNEYSIQALDLLNIVLASLIVLILGKLAYDYYYFKRTGRLPWIVMKMP